MKLVISVSSSLGTGRPLLRCHLCKALRSCDVNVLRSGSTLDFFRELQTGHVWGHFAEFDGDMSMGGLGAIDGVPPSNCE